MPLRYNLPACAAVGALDQATRIRAVGGSCGYRNISEHKDIEALRIKPLRLRTERTAATTNKEIRSKPELEGSGVGTAPGAVTLLTWLLAWLVALFKATANSVAAGAKVLAKVTCRVSPATRAVDDSEKNCT